MKQLKLLAMAITIIAIGFSANAQVKKETKKKPKSPFRVGFCSTLMPAFKGLEKDTGNTRALADNYKLWDNGKVLYGKFLGNGGSQKIREKVKKAAKEWEKYANITFNFIESGDAHIRVLLTNVGGCNSKLGTDALTVDPNEKTMNIDTNFFYNYGQLFDILLSSTIQHEFGHAIGLLHEHYYKNKVPWNKEVVYKEAAQSPNNWSKATVDYQIFSQFDGIYTNGFQYDKLSIMHYGFPARWTLNNIEIKPNYVISEKDKETVGLLYPKNAPRTNEFPRFSVTNLTPTKVINSSQRNGLIICPSFKLTTAGRVAKLILTARLYDSNGNVVLSTDNQKVVGAAKIFNLPPGKQFDINKGVQDFEMFIPYSEFDKSMKNYKILFQIKMFDDINNITNYLGADIVNYNQIKSN